MLYDRRRLAEYLRGTANPYAPQPTMESKVSDQLRTLDPSNIPGYPQAPQMPDMPPPRSPHEAAAMSTEGAKARLQNKQAFANSLRDTPMPQGQMAGRLYVRNPYDSLAAAVQRGVGAHMSRKLGDEYTEIDQREQEKARGRMAVEEGRIEGKNAFEAEQARRKIEADALRALEDRTSREGISAADRTSREGISAADRAIRRELEGMQQKGQNARAQNVTSWQLPNGSPLHTVDVNGVQHQFNQDGTLGDPIRIPEGAIPLDSGTEGSGKLSTSLKKIKDESSQTLDVSKHKFATMDLLGGYSYEDAKLFTGYNPSALGAEMAIGPRGKEAQEFHNVINTDAMGGVLNAIKGAGLTPVSNVDLENVKAMFVKATQQPETIAQFYVFTGRNLFSDTLSQNVRQGNIDQEQAAALQEKYDLSAGRLAVQWGYSPAKMKTLGMNPEMVDYLVEEKRRQEAGDG